MHSVLNQTKVERLLINKAHNGGGFIHPTTPLYASSLYEDYTHPLGSIKEKVQRLQLDEEFIRLILELCQRKLLRVRVSDLKPCLMKTLYDSENVRFVEFRFIGQDRKNVYFASYATTQDLETFDTPWQQAAINFSANIIKNNIR